MTKFDRVLAIMAKAPRVGFVKTRLERLRGPEQAVALYRCLLEDTIALARSIASTHVAIVCPAGDERDLQDWLGPALDIVGQQGSGLADGLTSAFAHFFDQGCCRVVLFNSDSPHLPRHALDSAFSTLDASDLVVGPTDDGGYYLVGAKASHQGLFEASPLGGGSALQALLARARGLGLSTAVTQHWYDVDLPNDLRRLAANLRGDPQRAPRTAALLATWLS